MTPQNKIDRFQFENRFLSNFYPAAIEHEGITYPSVEHYYVAMKTLDLEQRTFISQIGTAGLVKKYGRTLEIRPDWNEVKFGIMEIGLRKKFAIPELKEKLLATGDAYLEEGNWWGDVYWGVCNGTGENNLGKLLMQIREELK